MKDRNTQYPGRKKLTIISQSSSEIVADVERYEGTVTEVGTPLNKASILPDTLAEKLGLDPEADPTPADALQAITLVPLDTQELYMRLIAPFSVSLDFEFSVGGSYLYYGIPWDSELRVFIKVIKQTSMSGTNVIGTLPSGYRPDTAQTLTAYGDDGNILSDVTVTIGTDGAVSVIGNVEKWVIVIASYNSSDSQSVGLTYKDINRLISQNGAVIKTNDAWPEFESDGSRYRKFADGRAEIDIHVSATKDCTVSAGSGWYTQSVNTIRALPIVLTSIDMLTPTLFPANAGCMLLIYTTGFPTEIQYRLQHSASKAGINFTAHFRVLGRWK